MDIERKRTVSPRQEANQINLNQNIKSQTKNDETAPKWLQNCICLPKLLSSDLFDKEACLCFNTVRLRLLLIHHMNIYNT